MYGAILGDIIGSPYEFDVNNIKTTEFELFSERSEFTDDSIMTLAVADALMNCGIDADEQTMKKAIIEAMREYGRRYPFAGYGVNFSMWLAQKDPKPYDSYGNGSAMRVSSVPWLCQEDMAKMLHIAAVTAQVTHNHPEGIKGAQATAAVIFMAIHGAPKELIRDTVSKAFGYDLTKTCDEIRPSYHHVESCQETVPQAICAFLEGNSFEEVIRLAVSLGGDSDTLTCIAGSMAEAFYGVPEELRAEAEARLPEDLRGILDRFESKLEEDRKAREKDPARMDAWKNALTPQRHPSPGKGPHFIGSEAIEKCLEELRKDHSRENMIRSFEAVRMAMRAGGYFLLPVLPAQAGEGNEPAKRVLKMKLAGTKDGRVWQIVYSSEKAYRSGKTPKEPAMAITIRQTLEQFIPEAPGANKAPAKISGILLNPDLNPLFLAREVIEQIMKMEEMARKASQDKSVADK